VSRHSRASEALPVLAAIVLLVASTGAIVKAGAGTALGSAVPSPIEQVPVPRRAALDRSRGGQGVGALTYRLPRGVTKRQLDAWYDLRLPWKRPYSTWAWCKGTRSSGLTQRTWTRRGTADVLAVALVYDRHQAPVGILVSEAADGRC
jgi:hypothetical protein